MSTDPPGEQVWRPSRKQAVLAMAGAIAVVAGLLLTMPEDKQKPLRPTSVSRAAQPTASEGVSKPAEGRFVYQRTVESSGERNEEEVSRIVTHLDGDLIDEVSATVRDGKNRPSSGLTLRWASSGVTRTAMQLASLEEKPPRCQLDPPLLTMPLPLQVGLRWESASVCGEGKGQTQEEISGHVVRTERVQTAGVELDTFVIETVSGRGQRGLFWFATEGTQWFSPQLGMSVRSTEVTRDTQNATGFRRDITSELLAWPGGPPA